LGGSVAGQHQHPCIGGQRVELLAQVRGHGRIARVIAGGCAGFFVIASHAHIAALGPQHTDGLDQRQHVAAAPAVVLIAFDPPERRGPQRFARVGSAVRAQVARQGDVLAHRQFQCQPHGGRVAAVALHQVGHQQRRFGGAVVFAKHDQAVVAGMRHDLRGGVVGRRRGHHRAAQQGHGQYCAWHPSFHAVTSCSVMNAMVTVAGDSRRASQRAPAAYNQGSIQWSTIRKANSAIR